jgi:excisionase family DNA binding protein
MGNGIQPRTVNQAAEELGISRSTVRAWIGQRRIGFVRLGRAIRIPRPEIERLLETGFVPAVPEHRRGTGAGRP